MSEMTNLDYALAYAAKDWQVFPCWQVLDDGSCACGNPHCKSIGKHPIASLAPKGQHSATSDATIINEWWTQHPDANIAIYLAGSGLCAVDIDPRNGGGYTIQDLEAVHGKIDSDVLALTGGGGEHRVFMRPAGEVTLAGTLGRGVDMKLNGYIIAAPSNHVLGRYEWEASSDPLDGAVPSPLPDWIRSFSLHGTPTTSGGALRHGMSDEQHRDVLAALDYISSDERDTWLTVGMALQATGDSRAYELWCDWSAKSDKYDQNDQYRVWRSFRGRGVGSVDLPTIFKLAQDNGWYNHGGNHNNNNAPTMAVDEAYEVDDVALSKQLGNKYSTDTVPSHLLSTPVPVLNELIDWMESFSREPQRQITMQGVLALASVLCGRIYQSTEANTSSLYLMVLGETGIGKNYVKTAIQQFLVEAGFEDLLSGSGNTSSGAVYSAMIESPCHIQIMDEVGKHLQTARKQVNGQMAEGFSTLVEAYSATTSLMIPKNYSNMGKRKSDKVSKKEQMVHCPAVTILGLATPAQVYENLSTKEIEDGFLNRLVVVDVSYPQEAKRRSKRLPLSEELLSWARLIRHPVPTSPTDLTGYNTDHTQRPQCIDVDFDDDALAVFDGYHDLLKQMESDGAFALPDLTRRWVENAMRLATALAVCSNSAHPIITAKLADWAVQYVSHYGRTFMDNVATKVADSDFHRLYLAVQDFIIRAGEHGMTERDLARHCRLFAASSPAQRDQVLVALDREGLAHQFSFKPVSGRGRPRHVWFAEKFITDELLAMATK